jgi:hypothetical protein
VVRALREGTERQLQADATQPSPQEVLAGAGHDVEARVEAMAREITRMVLRDKALFRSKMRVSQELWFAGQGDPSMPVREGRRLVWIDGAFRPLAGKVTAAALARLRNALAVVVGVEPVISLRDVCGLDGQEIEETLVWTAITVVRATLPGP